jgi:putative FmdB family regulatory protein
MPIYEYRCSSCGHQQEFLQKVGDAPLSVCTQCGKETFSKMLTAAGFQLKGSGWYATDFKNKGSAPAKSGEAKSGEAKSGATPTGEAKAAESKPAAESKSEGGKDSTKPASGGGTPST